MLSMKLRLAKQLSCDQCEKRLRMATAQAGSRCCYCYCCERHDYLWKTRTKREERKQTRTIPRAEQD